MIDALLGFAAALIVGSLLLTSRQKPASIAAPPGGFVCQCGHGLAFHSEQTDECAQSGCDCQQFVWDGGQGATSEGRGHA
jgi:hypothetical protein